MNSKIYLAAGCFWSVEEAFWQMSGVKTTTVGYMGGDIENPTYEEVCSGNTNHSETVEVIYNSHETSLDEILKTFWEKHDPTQFMRQGNDIGSQYRSMIFVENEEDENKVLETKNIYEKALTENGYEKIVTEIINLENTPMSYYLAEEYHQKYLLKNPNGYRCHSATGIKYPV